MTGPEVGPLPMGRRRLPGGDWQHDWSLRPAVHLLVVTPAAAGDVPGLEQIQRGMIERLMAPHGVRPLTSDEDTWPTLQQIPEL